VEEKVRALARAQKAGRVGTAFPPGFLVIAVICLATAWSAAGSFGPVLDPKAADRKADLRQSVIGDGCAGACLANNQSRPAASRPSSLKNAS
jgi:hypothetical protein